MRLKEAIEYLLQNSFLVKVGDELIFTKKCYQELKITTKVETALAIATPMEQDKNQVNRLIYSDNKKELWNQFIEATEIPHRVNTGTGNYTVRQYSKSAVDKLIKIISQPGVDYQILVDSTKNYYKTVTYKILLSRYLLEDAWIDEYTEFNKKRLGTAKVEPTPGANPFED